MKKDKTREINGVCYHVSLPVRIDDVNYGNHLAHDKIVTLMHEARLQYFKSLGVSEMDFVGAGLILTEMNVRLKTQAQHGDMLTFNMQISVLNPIKMKITYHITNDAKKVIADAYVMLCFFDYEKQRLFQLNSSQLAIIAEKIVES